MPTKNILPLTPEIISKIAAGEVIERPAFAVKELVENSIDAKADKISIVLEQSGLKKIMVTDNGIGMSKEDLLESFKLHTTSKLFSLDDLEKIKSLGFRGEALASIAAISKLTLQSRVGHRPNGTKIELVDGQIKDIAPIGMPPGTVVTVNNLFYSVPARKKFLKTPPTEFRHILQVLTNLVFANPQIHFYLVHNKKIIFDLPKTKDPLERIKFFLGNNIFINLLPVQYQNDFIAISGFVSKPHLPISLNNKHYFFINNRGVTNQLIEQAGKEGYGTLLPAKAKPVLILFLSIPYELVDVNVHPRKEQVHFANQQLVYDAVEKAVRETLTKNNLTFYAQEGLGGLALGEASLAITK
ncbi:MAG TPA: DNA mismatch repair endonuclease MutL, partial [Patescibacteria group bacterium]